MEPSTDPASGAGPFRRASGEAGGSGRLRSAPARRSLLSVGRALVVVRKLTPADAMAFQALRLSGLLECPAAFASSHEEEVDLAPSIVADRLAARDDRAVFGAFQGPDLVGLVGLKREERRKLSHKAFLWGMYVAPANRKRGVGCALVTEALAFAQTQLRVRQVGHGVNAENMAAIALYEHMGFKAFGREPCFMLVDGVAQDELQMVCMFPNRNST